MVKAPAKYQILEHLGAGGMGDVYKALDLSLLRQVAIKVIKKKPGATEQADARFLREARLVSRFNHPHIVTIYEIGEIDDSAYIVMEFIGGCSLRDRIGRGDLRGEEIIDIALQISDALNEAHSHGIIHRDIKPPNILLTERGNVKLLDFGVAKHVEDFNETSYSTITESLTHSDAIVGTLSYMSPEQLRREPLDGRTDIFSFGIVLYEMITGKLPFAGASALDVAASILKDHARDIARLPADLPQEIKPFVMRLLAKERSARPAAFREIQRQLEKIKKAGVIPLRSRATTIEIPPIDEESTISGSQPLPSYDTTLKERATAAHPSSTPSAPPTILVLPLEAVGKQEESAFIGIGIAHAIITKLAKLAGIAVLSKAAAANLLEQGKMNAQAIARELGATILLEGEVMRAGTMMAIMARLIDVKDGRVIWGEQYRGDAAEIFSIQDSVCESIALALRVSLSQASKHKPEHPLTNNLVAFELYSKGRAYLDQRNVKGNVDLAIQAFEEAIQLDKNFALAQAGLGEAYWQKYQKMREKVWADRAIAASDRALILDPTQAEVHVVLGIIYRGTGKVERAIEELQRAITIQPLQDEAYFELGRCYQQQGEFEKAVEHFERAIKIRPGYWNYYNVLGICYSTFGHYQEASEQFRRVISFHPDNQVGYNNLGGIYLMLGKYEDALAMHQKSVAISENDTAYSNIGTCYFYLGQYEKAIEAYQAALKLSPRNDIYYRNLGDAYLRLNKKAEAQEQFKTALRLLEEELNINSNDAMTFAKQAVCKAKLDDKQEALEAIERAHAIEPRNPEIIYLHATVHALTGNREQAIEELNHALSSGYSLFEAERDLDLESIRNEEAYQSLLKHFS